LVDAAEKTWPWIDLIGLCRKCAADFIDDLVVTQHNVGPFGFVESVALSIRASRMAWSARLVWVLTVPSDAPRSLEIGPLTIILVMSETMSLAAVKARFSELVDRVERQQDRVVVTRNGKPAAVLISADDLESLEETLAVMSARSVVAQLRESQKAVAAGEDGVDLAELRAGLDQRRASGK
jgi:antitoxin YefM